MNGLIFDIHSFFMHNDGGIRTVVFFKGCPLHCPWCSNPEGQSFEFEWARVDSRCIHCSKCCYNAEECPSGAIADVGRYVTLEYIIKEIQKDTVFHNASGGGVTLTGGEVLSQWNFASKLLEKLKALGINTSIETSGQGEKNHLLALTKYSDLTIYDLKIMDKKKAVDILWADADVIRDNLRELVKCGRRVIPRISLVQGYTMDEENISSIVSLIKDLNLNEVYLLPFRHYGSNKYDYMGRVYALKNTKSPSDDDIYKIKNYIEKNGIKVTKDTLKVSSGITKVKTYFKIKCS